jgi:hypothetical protein
MDGLSESLRPLSAEASPAKMLLINVGMKYGGHFLKKFPTGPMPDLAGAAVAVQNVTTRVMHIRRFVQTLRIAHENYFRSRAACRGACSYR